RLLAVEDRPALDRPVDDFPGRTPWLLRRKEVTFQVISPLVRRHRPMHAPTIRPRHENEALAGGGITVVGGIQLAPFWFEAQPLDRLYPRVEILALTRSD